jgi:PAS domain S-box-containing protein
MEVGDRAKKSGRHRRKDGSTFPIEVWVDKTEIAGEKRFIALSRDVTQQLKREQRLEALTEEYRALLENADDAIFFLQVDQGESGPEFRFERLNPYHEAATGLDTENVRGKTPREVLGPDLGAELEANYCRCVEAGKPISYQEELQMPAGTRTWQTKLAPVVVDGTVTRIVGIARDVTAQVHREAELRRKNERLDEFAGIVAHDLRNPLNVAQVRTTLVAEDPSCEDLHREKAQEALVRMEDIISDMLVLARQGNEVESLEPVSVPAITEQCWDMVETDAATLVVDDECTIEADPDRLRHVFENLFRNAVEHGPEDIAVQVGQVNDDILYVEDDGPGIPPERREAVFQPGETSREAGTGFGLSIVKRIAEAHGWTVRLTDATGEGTRFEFAGVEILS